MIPSRLTVSVSKSKQSKVRVVFDCAVRFQGASLNERILQGPDLTNTLIGVLSRFRQESTAVMTDVEQMLYEALVPGEDCNFCVTCGGQAETLRAHRKNFRCGFTFLGVSLPQAVPALR